MIKDIGHVCQQVRLPYKFKSYHPYIILDVITLLSIIRGMIVSVKYLYDRWKKANELKYIVTFVMIREEEMEVKFFILPHRASNTYFTE